MTLANDECGHAQYLVCTEWPIQGRDVRTCVTLTFYHVIYRIMYVLGHEWSTRERYFDVYFPSCTATCEINIKITPKHIISSSYECIYYLFRTRHDESINDIENNFSEILIKVYTFALKEMHFKNSVCKMTPISYRSECVKARWLRLGWRRVSFKTVGSSSHCHKALRTAAHSCIYVKSSLPDSSFTEFCSQWFNWQLGCIGSSTGLAPTNAYPVHWRIHTCGIRGRWAIGDYRQGPVIPA